MCCGSHGESFSYECKSTAVEEDQKKIWMECVNDDKSYKGGDCRYGGE